LNTFQPAKQQVMLGNVFIIQDFFFPGYTAEFLALNNKDDGGLALRRQRIFLVRPAPVGNVINQGVGAISAQHPSRIFSGGFWQRAISSASILTHAFYEAAGKDSFNPIAGRRVTVNARKMAGKWSFRWTGIGFVTGFRVFYSSGDNNPRQTGGPNGFDAIVDLPSFCGRFCFSFWNREGISACWGREVSLTTDGSLLPEYAFRTRTRDKRIL